MNILFFRQRDYGIIKLPTQIKFMAEEITKEKFWQIYNTLPEDLQDALFSEDIGETISYIFKRQGVKNDDAESFICDKTGDTFLGILPPEVFAQEIKKILNVSPEAADKVIGDINERIFYPLKDSLEKLYKVKMAVPAAVAQAEAKIASQKVAQKPAGDRVVQAVCPPCPPCVKAPAKPKIAQPVILRQAPAPKPVLKKAALPLKPQIQPQSAPPAQTPLQTQPPGQSPLSASPNAMRRKVF